LKLKKALISLSLSLALLVPTTSTFANEVSEEKNYNPITEIKKHYKDEKVQERLIKKVKKGELLDNANPNKRALGIQKQIDKNTILTTYPDGSESLQGIDYSEATFYDENGNETENPYERIENSDFVMVVEPNEDEPVMVMAWGITKDPVGVSGGTWSSGTGYSCVKGAKVYDWLYGSIEAYFFTDFCNLNGAYDTLNRVYGVYIETGETWSILDEGVFRASENVEYSAFGGVKFQAKVSADSSMKTYYLYVRVGGDSYWYESNI
jgi:hypothetical protein